MPAVLLIFLIGFSLFFFHGRLSGITEAGFKEKIDSCGIWGPVLYVIVYLLRPLILFPAGVLSASAGLIWGTLHGFIILQIAANISSTAEFFVARTFGREFIEKFLKGRFLNVDRQIENHGFLTVLLIRLIPNVAWDIQNLGLGLTRVKFRDYFPATFLGIMPGSFAFVFFGSSLIRVLFHPGNVWFLVLAAGLFAGLYFLRKGLKKRKFL